MFVLGSHESRKEEKTISFDRTLHTEEGQVVSTWRYLPDGKASGFGPPPRKDLIHTVYAEVTLSWQAELRLPS